MFLGNHVFIVRYLYFKVSILLHNGLIIYICWQLCICSTYEVRLGLDITKVAYSLLVAPLRYSNPYHGI